MNFKHFIATAAFALLACAANAGQILVVLSDESRLELQDQRSYATGFYLNELIQPVRKLLDAGHTLIFATPTGRAPAVDKSSLDKMYFGGDEGKLLAAQSLLEKLELTDAARSPVLSLARIEQIGYGRFDAVYVPGGHAPMQDLLYSPALGKLLAYFHHHAKPTALVCHGPVALLATLDDPAGFTRQLERASSAQSAGRWIYAGYRMTVISNAEEEAAKGLLKGGSLKFTPETALRNAGGIYQGNPENWTANVVTDRELITGQNPASADAVADALLHRLN
jgi:putative intracellular protease/amidase